MENNVKRTLSVLILALCIFLTSCKAEEEKTSLSFYAMDTIMSIDAYGESSESASLAKDRVLSLEKLFSVTDENSELFALNKSGSAELGKETLELIKYALDMSEKTGGALDPTIYPVLREWGFTVGEYKIPDSETLSALLNNVGADKVHIDENSVTLDSGVMLDLGAVAKGYASEECYKILKENNVRSALINLGGNIRLLGKKPDGDPWKIGVADPLSPSDNLGILSVTDCAVVTSGNYQRFFEENGKTYGHIIDPKTGFPADNDLLSVTVISDSGTLCDALSTALFVMGSEKAEQFWRDNKNFEAVFVLKDNTVHVTEGIYGIFSLENKDFELIKTE